MSDYQSSVLLHNYPQSPVAEKVRVAIGIKGINWHSVEIPRLPPKPMLTPLTGGYRRTPVMQIGSDIYCDSQCIALELERRFPEPGFFPSSEGPLIWGLSRLVDGSLFDLVVKIVLGSAGDELPQDFAQDRGRLYLGPDWAAGLKAAHDGLPHLVSQLRTPFMLLDQQLSDGRSFLVGDMPAYIDAQYYCLYWFIEGRWSGGPEFLSQFPNLNRWADAVKSIGHGTHDIISAETALEVAGSTTPHSKLEIDDRDPLSLKAGDVIMVCPDVDGGEEPVTGCVVGLSTETITIKRSTDELGDIHVHFPRVGYLITRG